MSLLVCHRSSLHTRPSGLICVHLPMIKPNLESEGAFRLQTNKYLRFCVLRHAITSLPFCTGSLPCRLGGGARSVKMFTGGEMAKYDCHTEYGTRGTMAGLFFGTPFHTSAPSVSITASTFKLEGKTVSERSKLPGALLLVRQDIQGLQTSSCRQLLRQDIHGLQTSSCRQLLRQDVQGLQTSSCRQLLRPDIKLSLIHI